jgi:spore coat polysaccharide biosynthesis protein SpsF|tara:strand:- start:2173 stop:2865 length:693 start_codon:yes stop_codon:yes gene_type:complete
MVYINLMKVFIQARMSSTRLPKKVFINIIKKKHTLDLIIEKLLKIFKKKELVVLTSQSKSDDPIKRYCNKKKVRYFRGSLSNVSKRFLNALEKNKCKYFLRISADSPLIDVRLIKTFLKNVKGNKYDIVTNVCPRTFPRGQSFEIINTQTYINNFQKFKTKKDFEHVTNFFYNFRRNFRIKNIRSKKNYSKFSLALDTKDDLSKIKRILDITKKADLNFLKYVSVLKEGF